MPELSMRQTGAVLLLLCFGAAVGVPSSLAAPPDDGLCVDTPCVIVSSALERRPNPKGGQNLWVVRIRYAVEVGGKRHVIETCKPSFVSSRSEDLARMLLDFEEGKLSRRSLLRAGTEDEAEARLLHQEFSPNARAVCIFDPESPDDSLLLHAVGEPAPPTGPNWWLYCGVGTVIGVAVFLFLKARWDPAFRRAWLAWLMAAGMAAWGGTGLWHGFILPVSKRIQSRRWMETPCTVTYSNIEQHGMERKYYIQVAFTYVYRERGYRSLTYDFSTAFHNNPDELSREVGRLRGLRKTVCYVNPSDPREAVLSRTFRPDVLVTFSQLVLTGMGMVLVLVTFWTCVFKPNAASATPAPGGPGTRS